MSIYGKIMEVQSELKAPKGQFNKFGNYKYRSCEDIVEAVKPILRKYGMTLNLKDDLILVGDRYYIKATATLYDTESAEYLSSSAFAREPLEKKGMDESQITGTASSYARKYALNGLLAIDDTKDADTDEYQEQTKAQTKKTETKKAEPKAEPKADPFPEQIPEPTETVGDNPITNERRVLNAIAVANDKGRPVEMKHIPVWLQRKFNIPETTPLNEIDPKIITELCRALMA